MSARAPDERPAEGETIQERDLERRKYRIDRQAGDQGQQPVPRPNVYDLEQRIAQLEERVADLERDKPRQ